MDNKKIFFSYSRKDASEFALKLANDLTNAGATIWIDQLHILPPQRWDLEIGKALRSADCILFIATKASVESDPVLDEINYALETNKEIYPIILDQCELPYRTRRLQRIDFTSAHEESTYKERLGVLLQALNLIKLKETTVAKNPTSATPLKQTKEETDNSNGEKEEWMWQQTYQNPSLTTYQEYLNKYPAGRYKATALAAIKALNDKLEKEEEQKQLWKTTKEKNDDGSQSNHLPITKVRKDSEEARQQRPLLYKQKERNPYRTLLKIAVPLVLAVCLVWYAAPHIFDKSVYSVPDFGIDAIGSISNTVNKNKVAQAVLKYDFAYPFKEGLAAVRKNGKYGFIDTIGREVVAPKYDYGIDMIEYLFPPAFTEGLAAVAKGVRWGYIDKSGKEVIPFTYDNAFGFNEGLAAIKSGSKCGFIDKTGKVVLPLKYDFAFGFNEGLSIVKEKEDVGFIDKTGKVVLPIDYELAINFKEGLALVGVEGEYGFISKTGKKVIPIKYEDVLNFSGGVAAVKQDKKWGYIDKAGKELIPLQYDKAFDFHEGLAAVKKYSQWGFINSAGKELIPLKYDTVGYIGYGLVAAYSANKKFIFHKDGKQLATY